MSISVHSGETGQDERERVYESRLIRAGFTK